MQPLLYIALLFIPVLAGGISVFFARLNENKLKLLLAFSAAYLLALSFLHLLPECYMVLNYKAGVWVLTGFFVQVLLEFFSHGIEHGHAHIHAKDHKIPFVMLAGLYLHSFIEGLPLSYIYTSSVADISFLIGISLHNIPIAMAFAGLLLHEHITKQKVLVYVLLLACMAPLGAFAGIYISGAFAGYSAMSTALVVGIFLHIATTIIFESSEKNHRYHISKLLSIVLGILLAAVLL